MRFVRVWNAREAQHLRVLFRVKLVSGLLLVVDLQEGYAVVVSVVLRVFQQDPFKYAAFGAALTIQSVFAFPIERCTN